MRAEHSGKENRAGGKKWAVRGKGLINNATPLSLVLFPSCVLLPISPPPPFDLALDHTVPMFK